MTVDDASLTRTTVPLRAHTSYSQVDELLRCGKAFQLHRVLQLPPSFGYARAGGSAVHEATEAYDRRRYAALGW